jgi:hypothetical protein
MAGSPSSSQSITVTTAGYRAAGGRSGRRMRCANRVAVVTGMLAIANGSLVGGSEERPIVGS